MSHQQFVDSCRGRKRVTYQNALDELRGMPHNLSEDAKIRVFVKFEKTDRTIKRDPVPRVISPRDPKFNIRVGRYFRRIEEKIFVSLGKLFGHRTVIKGVDVVEAASILKEKWDMFKRPVAVGLDASRFDQHVSLDALKWEHKVYLECFKGKHKKRLGNLLSYQLRNHCVGVCDDGRLHYTVNGTRMSGDMNTSLGNCVLMCSMMYAYSLETGIKFQLANNGDDCVCFMEEEDLERFNLGVNRFFLKLGFNMVVEEPAHRFEELEFCQTKPVYDGTTWTLCRSPLTATAKDSVLLRDPKNTGDAFIRQWYDAIGTGGLALAGGLPVFNNFYRLFQRSGQFNRINWKGKRVSMDAHEMLPWFMRETGIKGTRTFCEITPEARCSFWSAYGMTPDEQIALEDYYDSLTLTPALGAVWEPRACEVIDM